MAPIGPERASSPVRPDDDSTRRLSRQDLAEDRPSVPLFGEGARRREQTLAAARAFLGLAALVAVWLDPTNPARYARLAYLLLAGYATLALAVLAWARLGCPELVSRFASTIHVLDLCFAAALTLFTEGPNSPFFVLFVFPLLAAAYRWGLWATMATAVGGIGLLVLEAVLIAAGSQWQGSFGDRQFELNRLLIRAAHLLIVGVLAGYLGERQRAARIENAAIAWMLGIPRRDRGLRGTMEKTLDAIGWVFHARQVLCVVEDGLTGEVVRWRVDREAAGPASAVQWKTLDAAERGAYLFRASGDAWHVTRRRPHDGGRAAIVVDPHGERDDAASGEVAETLWHTHGAHALLVATLPALEEWTGRLFVVDPAAGGSRLNQILLVQRIVREVAPAVYNVYLAHRLRARAGAEERMRLARTLHDGITQSLISVEMQLDLLRRQAEQEAPGLASELGKLRRILQEEAQGLRDLMRQMKGATVRPGQLLEHLSDAVLLFQHDTGINARFISNVRQDELWLAPRVCRELSQIVQEALVNVRRHARADRVTVSLAVGDGRVKLAIDDDGRGFPFSGVFTHAELDRLHWGPFVIKERARAIGAEIGIASTPGRGARVEVTLPVVTGTPGVS